MRTVYMVCRRDGVPVVRTIYSSRESAEAKRDELDRKWHTPDENGKTYPVRGPYVWEMRMED